MERLCVMAGGIGFLAGVLLGLFFDFAFAMHWSSREIFWGAVICAFMGPMFVGCYDRRPESD
ncbi:MAG: hypothetical protein HZA68_13030 [Rhodovulum sp.]|nr:hypothetical protein [Rhodovulum sp.]